MSKRGPKGPLTPEHKAAMAAGRVEGRTVRKYLEALRNNKPKRGRKRTADSIRQQIANIDEQIANADPIDELMLVQKRRNLTRELDSLDTVVDISALEREFVKIAKVYGDRQGISYASWREVGVDPSVLKAAGITR